MPPAPAQRRERIRRRARLPAARESTTRPQRAAAATAGEAAGPPRGCLRPERGALSPRRGGYRTALGCLTPPGSPRPPPAPPSLPPSLTHALGRAGPGQAGPGRGGSGEAPRRPPTPQSRQSPRETQEALTPPPRRTKPLHHRRAPRPFPPHL